MRKEKGKGIPSRGNRRQKVSKGYSVGWAGNDLLLEARGRKDAGHSTE